MTEVVDTTARAAPTLRTPALVAGVGILLISILAGLANFGPSKLSSRVATPQPRRRDPGHRADRAGPGRCLRVDPPDLAARQRLHIPPPQLRTRSRHRGGFGRIPPTRPMSTAIKPDSPTLTQETDMAITDRRTATTRDPMTPLRKTALVAGVFYLITFISIPTLFLYGTLKTDRGFITSAGSSTSVLVGAVLEVIVALAGIGTAVTLFPVVKRQNEAMALGFVAVRTLEAAMIFTGVLSLLSLVHLRQDLGASGGADPASLSPPARHSSRPTTGQCSSDRP